MKPSTERDYRRRIARVIEAILVEPGAPHTLESLAAVAHLSPYHFHRIYRALTGESVVETVQRLRLAQAAQRLTDAAALVTTVAHDAGYNSPQAFARAFRGFTGVTPSEFKARQKRFAAPSKARRTSEPCEAATTESRMSVLPAVELAEIAPIDVMCLRHAGPVATIGQTYRSLMDMLRCEGSSTKGQRVGLCMHDPALSGGFQYYAGIVATPHAAPRAAEGEAIETVRVEGGLYAVHRLVGPYALIAPTFRALYGGWLPQSGYARDDRPGLEVYRNPMVAGLQHACVTDLMIPIRKD
ncbi:AraC family transcriptional regulator [Paraburkholderia caffeinilytica]|uniref:AraC family transcriptional regulator n=1 Tax=Paraburkholderia caffeinilytica TaxID=1761016 RepID=UPI0038BCC223